MGGAAGMGSMGSMSGMGSAGSMAGMSPSTGGQDMSMNMDQGAALRSLVQLVTLQDVLETLLDLTEAQDKALAAPGEAARQDLARELARIREQIREILRDNRAQIINSAGGP